MADKTSSFIEQCRARAIKARHEELGLPVSLAQTYELLAAAEGHRTWAAMRASGEASTMADAPDEAYELKAAESGTRIATLKVTRRISLDAQAAGSLHRDALIGAAHAELSFALLTARSTLRCCSGGADRGHCGRCCRIPYQRHETREQGQCRPVEVRRQRRCGFRSSCACELQGIGRQARRLGRGRERRWVYQVIIGEAAAACRR